MLGAVGRGRRRRQVLHHAQVAAGQRGGHGQVGIDVHARHAVFQPAVDGGGIGHADATGAVVVAPAHIGRRRHEARQAAVGIDVRRQQQRGRRRVFFQPGDIVEEQPAGAAVVVAEDVLARLRSDDALVDMHGAARLRLHRLGHEGGEDAMPQRRLAHGALEQEHAVGQFQRVAVGEVDLHLARARLVDQRFHAQLVQLAEG